MIVIDTNIILRYLLNDHEELSEKARELISGDDVLLYSYGRVTGEKIRTFDKKLINLLETLNAGQNHHHETEGAEHVHQHENEDHS